MKDKEPKILVVEDDSVVAMDIKESLRFFGYRVVSPVSTGEAALESVEKHHPNLVMMDIKLEGRMDGISAAEKIHAYYDIPVIYLSAYSDSKTLRRAKATYPYGYIVKPFNHREFISKVNAVLYRKHRISCIGGGTGLFTLLMGLKTLSNVLLTSIVSMTDDGGSSGRLRISFGILPPGDIRRSLVALSNAPEFMNDVIQHRFSRGSGLKGHSFGNLFLTALAEIKGSMSEAVKGLGDILNIQGIVVPANITLTKLCAEFEDGTVVKGESKIDLAEDRKPELHVKRLWHEPPTECGISTYSAIIHSDLVTIGPGDLFTSVITNITVSHIREALSKTKAKKVYICNLMTKPGETFNYDAADHIAEIVKYLGEDCLDYIIISNSELSAKAIKEYSKKNQSPVGIRNIEKIRKLSKADVLLVDVGHEEELVRH
ncbi:MAG: uridine diphosphate-N-acetylglucosamine-binding protein YvcK, partial [Nitrospinae bacterium]|nr:uridine diphosphate-N-acetylglucosamine-binding protein YvcK [Nitrospinota bacterium]